MQAEMTAGGSALWFDLFVAMVEHLVSLSRSPTTIAHRSLVHTLMALTGRSRERQNQALN
jgi:hypothetical protein